MFAQIINLNTKIDKIIDSAWFANTLASTYKRAAFPLTNVIFLTNDFSTISPDQCCFYHFTLTNVIALNNLVSGIFTDQKALFSHLPPTNNMPKLSHSWLEVSNEFHMFNRIFWKDFYFRILLGNCFVKHQWPSALLNHHEAPDSRCPNIWVYFCLCSLSGKIKCHVFYPSILLWGLHYVQVSTCKSVVRS